MSKINNNVVKKSTAGNLLQKSRSLLTKSDNTNNDGSFKDSNFNSGNIILWVVIIIVFLVLLFFILSYLGVFKKSRRNSKK